jgi:hypothetical protein
MPKLTWVMLVIGAILIAPERARAQTYDPNFPVCLQTYGIDGGNPYFTHAGRNSPVDRRQRGIY